MCQIPPKPPTGKRCPSCGACQECGAARPLPYWPNPYTSVPQVTWQQVRWQANLSGDGQHLRSQNVGH